MNKADASPEPAQEGESFRPQPAHVIIEREQRNGFTYIHCACGTVTGPFHKPEYAEDAFDNHTQSVESLPVEAKGLDEQDCHPAPSLERVEFPPLDELAIKVAGNRSIWGTAMGQMREEIKQRERQLLAEMKVSAGLRAELKAMTEDRNLWRDEHNGDCPNSARVENLEAELNTANTACEEGNEIVAELRAELQSLRERQEKAEGAIRWALCESAEDFRQRGANEGAYWWRNELRERANLTQPEHSTDEGKELKR